MKLDNEQFIYIKTNLRWKTTFTDMLIKYSPFGFAVVGLILSLLVIFLSNLNLELILWNIGLIIAGLIGFYFSLLNSRIEKKFRRIKIKDTSRLPYYFKKLHWKIESINYEFITAISKSNIFSLGETITVIIENERILFNSRYVWSASPFIDKNKLNMERIKRLIEDDNSNGCE